MDTGAIIVLSILGIIILSFITYAILGKLKGSLKIILLENSKSSGEKFTGSIELIAKKKIESERFSVDLVAKEERTHYQDWSRKTSYIEIYRFEKTIEGQKIYSAGFHDIFTFEIDIPSAESIGKNNLNNLNDNIKGLIEKNQLGDSLIGKALDFTVSNNLLSNDKVLRWEIIANIDAKGIDLTDGQRVYVNLHSSWNFNQNSIQN